MSWWAIEVEAAEGLRDDLAAWLVLRTGQAVEERSDGPLVAYVRDVASAGHIISQLAADHGPAVAASHHQVTEVDWMSRWRDGIVPRSFGRLTIAPSWVQYEPTANETVVVIDPESAFGSGEHGSTRAALRLLERFVKPGDFVLDVGSGSGILAIGAARLGAGHAVGIEQDEEALEIAQRNAQRNGVGAVTEFFHGDAGQLAPLFLPVDLVLANILRSVNVLLLPEIHRALRQGGTAIFSGMEKGEAAEFRAPLLAGGFEIIAEVLDSDWWAVAAERV